MAVPYDKVVPRLVASQGQVFGNPACAHGQTAPVTPARPAPRCRLPCRPDDRRFGSLDPVVDFEVAQLRTGKIGCAASGSGLRCMPHHETDTGRHSSAIPIRIAVRRRRVGFAVGEAAGASATAVQCLIAARNGVDRAQASSIAAGEMEDRPSLGYGVPHPRRPFRRRAPSLAIASIGGRTCIAPFRLAGRGS